MSLLIDVSHIYYWKEGYTGIEKVEHKLITYYSSFGYVRFIVWNKYRNRFEYIQNKKILSKINATKKNSDTPLLFFIKKHLYSRPKTTILIKKKDKIIILAGLWDDKCYTESLLEFSQNHQIVHIVYDMIPLVKPEFVVDFLPKIFSDYMLKILPRCSAIATISESSKKDIIHILTKNNHKAPLVKVFRLGEELNDAYSEQVELLVNKKYILTVGTIEIRKNHNLLYDAFLRLSKTTSPLPKLVIVGKWGWLTEDFKNKIKKNSRIAESVIILNTVSNNQLKWLYQNCLYTVFPSFYEGWGLPVSESLNYGKVTLSSSASSMKEIGGSCADYFSPFDIDELTQKMKKYLNNVELQKRTNFIKNNYKPMTWAESCENFKKIIDDI